MGRGLRWLLLCGVFALPLWLPPLQVLLVRAVDPPWTWTMYTRARVHPQGDWPAYTPMPLTDLGRALPRAVVASEDSRFWYHHGVDPLAIRLAIARTERDGKLRGASTLTQQVARNVFLWQERSWLRKGLEVVYTLWLELLLPKERILELYVNVAEMGPGCFGAEACAQQWFHKHASALRAEEAARIAAILPSPRKWNAMGELAGQRAAWIEAHLVPFPGEPGFDRMGRAVEHEVGWDAIISELQKQWIGD